MTTVVAPLAVCQSSKIDTDALCSERYIMRTRGINKNLETETPERTSSWNALFADFDFKLAIFTLVS
jgi:hypothetical protein